MQLTLENTTKGVIKLSGLFLKPGENELTKEQLAAWQALRVSGTSKDLLRNRVARWPANVETMMSNGLIKVTKASGADDRDVRRKSTKQAPVKSASGSPKPKKMSDTVK